MTLLSPIFIARETIERFITVYIYIHISIINLVYYNILVYKYIYLVAILLYTRLYNTK